MITNHNQVNIFREITWEYKGKEIIPDVSTLQTNRFKRFVKNTALSIEIFGRKPKLREKRDASVNNDGVLNVLKVTKSDNGASYACVVRSPTGEMAKRSFELHVVEPPQLEEIMLAPDLQEGQIVQIHCNLKSGDSPVYYSWLKDGKKIPTHLKVSKLALPLCMYQFYVVIYYFSIWVTGFFLRKITFFQNVII